MNGEIIMEPKSSRIATTAGTSHRVSEKASLHSVSATQGNTTPNTQRPLYTFRDIFLDPDPRIPLWERIKGGASLSLLPFALFCGGLPPENTEDGGLVSIEKFPDASGDMVSGKDLDLGADNVQETDGEVQCDPNTYISKDYNECGVGWCRVTVPKSLCLDGRIVSNNRACMPREPLSVNDTTCDGIDDDCDGEIDEQYFSRSTGERCGDVPEFCQGFEWKICGEFGGKYGEWVVCEGEYLSRVPCDVGVGECYREGVLECIEDGLICSAEPGGIPTGVDDDCDARDEDCDGMQDEHFVPISTLNTCGIGACETSAILYCSPWGELDEYCEPHSPTTEVDYICNGIDDDCDGEVDEEYSGGDIRYCGEGSCGFFATTEVCIDGTVVDYGCPPEEPIEPIGLDNDCNGRDEDCDGEADEHFQPIETVCGVGESISEGHLVCIGGLLECVPDS